MTTVLLVRHGFSKANEKGFFAGHTDVDLSDLGYTQAAIACDYILNNFKVDKVYSSDLKRAFNTVKGIGDKLKIEVKPERNFREIYAGDWEGLSFEDIKEKFPNEYAEWMVNTGFARCNNGESMQELQERAFNRLLEIAKQDEGKTVVIGTHAGVIRALECKINNIPLSDMKLVGWVANASVTVLNFDGERFIATVWGYSEHLTSFKTDVSGKI